MRLRGKWVLQGFFLPSGKAIAATYGTGHIFYCSGDDFKHLTTGYTKGGMGVNLII